MMVGFMKDHFDSGYKKKENTNWCPWGTLVKEVNIVKFF
jgi:hypothetical protein